ncbi:MAG: transglutaminase family protein [bacterium]
MSYKKKSVAAVAGLLAVFLFYQQYIRPRLRYYVTETVNKYDLLDYGLLPKYHKLAKNFRLINTNLDALNRKAAGLLEEKEKKANPEPLDFPPFFEKEPDSSEILRRIYLLSFFIDSLVERPDHPAKSSELIVLSKEISGRKAFYELKLPRDREIINKRIIIRNRGTKEIVNPKVIVNDRKKWFDIDSLVKSVVKPGMTDEEKALSIWNFLNRNRYGFSPPTEKREAHDVVKYLNAYGFGLCDDTASSFYCLARKAGLPSRIWALTGHVVSEVFFQNDWHMLDSDKQKFYLERDNKTIASVEDITRDPKLICRVPREANPPAEKPGKLEHIFATRENNNIGEFWMKTASASHNLNYRLRPGETFVGTWRGEGRYIAYGERYFNKPPSYGKGRFIYKPEKSFFNKGSLVIDFKTPYPITGGTVTVECSLKEKDNSLTVSFSSNRKKWWEISRTTGEKTGHRFSENFSNFFPSGYGDPLYTYYLKFDLSGAKPATSSIDRLEIITDTQLAPRSLPELERGVNKVVYLSDSPDGQAVEVEFQYSPGRKYHSPLNSQRLNEPESDKSRLSFSWNTPDNWSSGKIEYNFQLSGRRDFLIPLTPDFDIITEKKRVIIDREWFNRGQTYYWRIRSRYMNEPWGSFSPGRQLVIK